MIPRVFVATPLRASARYTQEENSRFAKMCLRDCLRRGEAPFAPHLLYPLVLHDDRPEERELGISAGLAFLHVCSRVACYVDRGVSAGMRGELRQALLTATPIEFRRLDGRELPTSRWLHDNAVPHEECERCYGEVEILADPILPGMPLRPTPMGLTAARELPTVGKVRVKR